MTEPKLCVQCRHMQDRECRYPSNVTLSLIDGQLKPLQSMAYLRQRHGKGYVTCEPEGRWWEPNVQIAAAA